MNYNCAKIQNTQDFGILEIALQMSKSYFFSKNTVISLPRAAEIAFSTKVFKAIVYNILKLCILKTDFQARFISNLVGDITSRK